MLQIKSLLLNYRHKLTTLQPSNFI